MEAVKGANGMSRLYHQTEAETSTRRALSVPNGVRRWGRWSSGRFSRQ